MCTVCTVYYIIDVVMGDSACDCESEGCTRMPTDQLVGCPGDEARQCKMYDGDVLIVATKSLIWNYQFDAQ